jgi:hypothetical protein
VVVASLQHFALAFVTLALGDASLSLAALVTLMRPVLMEVFYEHVYLE